MSLPPSFFDDMYAAADDPWEMRTRWYERRKYALTTAVLPRERYGDGLEVGCSVGELTARLAERCDRLTGWDASAAAVERATARVAGAGSGAGGSGAGGSGVGGSGVGGSGLGGSGLGTVRIEQAAVPDRLLPPVDLLVLSEVLYYLDAPDLQRFAEQVRAAVRPGGTVVAVHWRHPVPEYPQTGDAVHAALRAALPWPRVAAHEEPDLLLDCWVAAGADDVRAASVAAAEELW